MKDFVTSMVLFRSLGEHHHEAIPTAYVYLDFSPELIARPKAHLPRHVQRRLLVHRVARWVVPPSAHLPPAMLREGVVQFNKLAAWRLTAYDRVVLFDSDVMCRADVSELFTLPGQLSHSDGGASPLNGGVLVLRPSEVEYARMAATARRANFTYADRAGWEGAGMPANLRNQAAVDQGFLWYWFHLRHKFDGVLLPRERYNLYDRHTDLRRPLSPPVLPTCAITSRATAATSQHSHHETNASAVNSWPWVKLFHFTLCGKPGSHPTSAGARQTFRSHVCTTMRNEWEAYASATFGAGWRAMLLEHAQEKVELGKVTSSGAETARGRALSLATRKKLNGTATGPLPPDLLPPQSFRTEREFATFFGRTHFFLHIPKTGGSSVEELLPADAQLVTPFTRKRPGRPHDPAIEAKRHEMRLLWGQRWRRFSPWHLPPDIYERRFNRSYSNGRPVFCVVRHPLDRLLSRLNYRCSNNESAPALGNEVRQLIAALAQPAPWDWFAPIDERNLNHAVPQSWYVWSQRGQTQCQCVVAFEKLKRTLTETWIRPNAENANGSVRCSDHRQARRYATLRRMVTQGTLPESWWLLHGLDLRLWQDALQDKSFCHFPPRLSRLFDFAVLRATASVRLSESERARRLEKP